MMQSELDTTARIAGMAAAFAEVQSKYPTLPRSKTVSVRTRTGGTYQFSYAPLEEILRLYRPILSAAGFSLAQSIVTDAERSYVRTKLVYKNGCSESCEVPIIVVETGPQAFSSAVTYARRMGVTLILCLAADDDDDANTAEGNTAAQVKKALGDKSGRPDTSKVDPDVADEYAQRMWDIVQAGDKARAIKLHDELNADDAMYTAANDIYKQICQTNKFAYGGTKWTELTKKVA